MVPDDVFSVKAERSDTICIVKLLMFYGWGKDIRDFRKPRFVTMRMK